MIQENYTASYNAMRTVGLLKLARRKFQRPGIELRIHHIRDGRIEGRAMLYVSRLLIFLCKHSIRDML